MNGIYETSSGDLLRAGFSALTAGGGETLRTDVPHPAKRRYAANETQMHRWNGSTWVLVTNPTKPGANIDRTISGGTITIPTTRRPIFIVTVDTENSASSDNLDAILGGDIGTVIILRIKAAVRTVTVRDNKPVGSDKIEAAGDFALSQIKDKMTLVRRNVSVWDDL